MYLCQSCHIVDAGQPILPFEKVNWIFGQPEKSREMLRNGLNAFKYPRRCVASWHDVHDMWIEEIAGG